MFQRAAEKRLVPEDYDASLWSDRLSRLKASPADADLAKFDAALTVSLMRYVRALNAALIVATNRVCQEYACRSNVLPVRHWNRSANFVNLSPLRI
jgi:hypothetical protein